MATASKLAEIDKSHYAEIMKAFIDTAKTFTQLATAALLLPIVFFRQLLGVDATKPVRADSLLLLSWASFLLAIGFGLLYQYLAVKYLAAIFWEGDWKDSNWLVKNPGYAFGCMLITFFLGALFFVVKAYVQLRAPL